MPRLWQQRAPLGRALRAFLGWPDYDAYLDHRRESHPGERPLDRAAFIRLAQEKRFSGSSARRCC